MQREIDNSDDIRHYRGKQSVLEVLYKVQSGESTSTKYITCTISSKNIIAFSTFQREFNSYVYVCDIVAPWEQYKVCEAKVRTSLLEWNLTGELLLMVNEEGDLEIWGSCNHSINSWACFYRTSFVNENILSCKFFNNGNSIYFNSQKKDLPLYKDKFEQQEFRPSLVKFGNTCEEGCILITSAGLLAAFIIPKSNYCIENYTNQQCMELIVKKCCIEMDRGRITSCCISYCPNGTFNVTIAYEGGQEVYCLNVALYFEKKDIVSIKYETLPTLFIGCEENIHIKSIINVNSGKENIIYIAYNSGNGSALQQWKLTKKHQNLHKYFQKSKQEYIYCEIWEILAKQHLSCMINEIHISKLPCDVTQIYAILGNNTVQVFDPGLKKVAFSIFKDERQIDCEFLAADITQMDQVLVIFDTYGHMYASQVPNSILDKSFKLNIMSLQVSLLEYSVITGFDASDVLLLNVNNLDALIEKLTENFMRQPSIIRQFYYSNFLALKSNMCRIQSKQQDFDNLIILHSISITFKSLLRPSDLSCQDKGPADNLAIILAEPLASDVDKVLFNLDAKDFTVEPLTLQSLQQLIQWVADLALNILHKLPEEIIKTKLNRKQGYDISRDIVAIGNIRELLVMIRIWGLLNSQCLPVYTKSIESQDVLATLFRLLTRLVQNPTEPDEILLDECSVLSSQVLISRKQQYNPVSLLNCHIPNIKPYPFVFSTHEPIGLQDVISDEVVFANSIKDGITNVHLGCNAKNIRKCVRCGFVSSLHKIAKSTAIKAWCNRWLYCHCGGFWKLM